MTATRSSAPTTDAAPSGGFALATAAAAQVDAGSAASIAWRFPALPDAVAEAARTAFGVTIISDDAADDPRDLPAFAALYAHARAEQIVRALARRTNLVLPAASALVIGDGPVAEVVASILSHGGTRIVRAIDDPVARLHAHLAGVRTVVAPWPHTDLVITTGEQSAPSRPWRDATSDAEEPRTDALRLASLAQGPGATVLRSLSEERSDGRRAERAQRVEVTKGVPASGVFIDASLYPGDVTAGEAVRPFVTKTGERAWHVVAPDVYEAADGASDRPTRVADALVALSILRTGARDAADARLAELALA